VIDPSVIKILEKLDKTGFEAAVVGGAVRAMIEKKKPKDWDITTNAKPEEIIKLFNNSLYTNRFGTVSAPINKNQFVQITTYRIEEKYTNKRHPDKIVWGKNLEEDLARRDFTINAMAYRLSRNKHYDLIDPFEGKTDYENKLIKTVGDPNKRFGEDALRLLRAVRFATTLGFTIESKTKMAITRNAHFLRQISAERIRDELLKIIESDNAAAGIILTKEMGLLKIILPELEVCFNVEQKSPKRHHIFDVGTHCVMSLKNCPSNDIIVRLATLLHDIGKAKVANITSEGIRTFYNHEVVGGRLAIAIASRFNLSGSQKDKLFKLVRFHQFTVNENQTDNALRRFIRNIGIENVEDMMDLRIADRLGGGLQQPESWRLKLFRKRLKDVLKKPFTVADLKINGHDVMRELKLKPGPKVGEILNMLFEKVVEDSKKNDREFLLKKLRTLNR